MKITFRVWILIAFVLFSLVSIFSIPPTFMEKGVLVKSIETNSTLFENGLKKGMQIIEVNNQKINNLEDFSKAMEDFSALEEGQTKKIELKTKTIEIIDLVSSEVINDILVESIPKTRIKTGLDLQGGARAIITAEDQKLTESQVDDLIDVSEQRLNVKTVSGWEVYFNLKGDIDWQITELKTILENKIPPKNWRNLDYIDLRFDRVFVSPDGLMSD